jgi:cytochrome c
MIVAALAYAACAAPAMAQADLAKNDGCLNCHAVDTKKVGPSFKDVAAKYKGKADAEAMLIDKITSGKGHPATKASPADAKAIVQWVLAQ